MLDPRPDSCRQIFMEHPVIDNDELRKLIDIDTTRDADFRSARHPCLYPVAEGGEGLAARSTRCAARRPRRSPPARTILVLSDRGSTAELAPIPSLLSTSAVHHHLIREKTRTQVGLVVQTGEPASATTCAC